MPRPQQPEINRSGRTQIDPDSRQIEGVPADTLPDGSNRRVGRVPEENRPGHHPEREQDKPEDLGGAGHGTGRGEKR